MKNTLLSIACTLLMGNLLSEAGESGGTDGHVPMGVVFHTETLHRSDGRGDNWCITWTADESQVTSMDDGDWLKTGRYFHNHLWTVDDPGNLTYQPKLSPKWISDDGREMVLIWSDAMKNAEGRSHTVNYRWNQMRITIRLGA